MLATRALVLDRPPTRGWWYAAQVEFLTQLDWMFMTYLFLVGLAHALAYRHESEPRALDSAHLETRLVEAQLQALQRQLHPHFLFNTLNTISGLMRTDVNAADRMMDRLGDLLRMTLSTSNIQEVPLREELEMLQKYLDIEQTRFGSRLSVRMNIHPDTLDAHVPNLLLQPLVENAVRHGIAPHSRPGLIVVEAARVGGQLRLQVRRQRRRPAAGSADAPQPGRRPGQHAGAAEPPVSRQDHEYYRISPFELESVLLEHESVAEAAVVPSPDPIRLAIPKAYVLLVAAWSARRQPRCRSSGICTRGWRRSSASAASNWSPNCRRRFREKSAACSCAGSSMTITAAMRCADRSSAKKSFRSCRRCGPPDWRAEQ